MELLGLQATEETLAEGVLKELKDRQATSDKGESEETLEQEDEITTRRDRRETAAIAGHREFLGKMDRKEVLVKSAERALMVEEANQDALESPVRPENKVLQDSLALQVQEVNLDQLVYQDPKERMETQDRGVLEASRGQLEKKEEGDLWDARENQENQDKRVFLDPLGPMASLVKMAEMELVQRVKKAERAMMVSQDSLDPRGQLEILAHEVDLDPEETVDKEVSLETRAQKGRKEKLDILDPTVPKDQEDQVLCNVIWSRRLEITVLAVMVSRNARSTPPS